MAESARLLALTLLLALGLRTAVAMPRTIPSESMLPGLAVGDLVLVEKWPYGLSRFSLPWAPPLPHGRVFGRLPARGDVVVFRAPPAEREDWIKRVIGLPGDTVELRGGRLWLNGREAPRVRAADLVLPLAAAGSCPPGREDGAACRLPRYREWLPDGRSYLTVDERHTPQDDWGPVTVPAGRLLLLGDNRDASEDSRFAVADGGIGLVPLENVEGRAVLDLSAPGTSWRHPLAWARAVRLGWLR